MVHDRRDLFRDFAHHFKWSKFILNIWVNEWTRPEVNRYFPDSFFVHGKNKDGKFKRGEVIKPVIPSLSPNINDNIASSLISSRRNPSRLGVRQRRAAMTAQLNKLASAATQRAQLPHDIASVSMKSDNGRSRGRSAVSNTAPTPVQWWPAGYMQYASSVMSGISWHQYHPDQFPPMDIAYHPSTHHKPSSSPTESMSSSTGGSHSALTVHNTARLPFTIHNDNSIVINELE
jgi:hypothetical protein